MRRLPFFLAVVLVVFLPPPARAAESLDDRSRAAVDRGLTWLAAECGANADAPAERGDEALEKDLMDAQHTVIAAISGLAFLSAGAADVSDSPYAGAYAACLKRVLAGQQEDG